MEFNEEQLENVQGGYSYNNVVDNCIGILYNKSMIRNENLGGGTVTLYLPATVKNELIEMGISLSDEEIIKVTEGLNYRITEYNNNLSIGRK